MNKEGDGRLHDAHPNCNTVIGKKDVGRVRGLTEEPEEGMGDELVVNEKQNQKVGKKPIIHGHVFRDVSVDELCNGKGT